MAPTVCWGRFPKRRSEEPRYVPPALPGGESEVDALKTELQGRLYVPQDGASYDQARGALGAPGVKLRPGERTPADLAEGARVTWNQDAVGRPAAIAGCASVENVQSVVKYAARHCGAETGVWLGVAGGRHSHQCMRDGMFVCDLSRLDEVTIDAPAKTISAQGGAQLGQLDAACKPHKLATTAGHNATTGIGGLALQGGHGYLERTFGLVVDNMLEFEIVIASGELLRCSSAENPELFWAVRGGGGNFGVVTKFVLQLHDFCEKIPMGTRVHIPLASSFLGMPGRSELMQGWFRMMGSSDTPREAAGALILPAGGPVVEVLVWVPAVVLAPNAQTGVLENTGKAGEATLKRGEAFWKMHDQGKFRLENTWAEKCYWSEIQRVVPVSTANMYQSGLLLAEALPVEATDKLSEFLLSANAPTSKCMCIAMPLGGRVSDDDLKDSSSNGFRDAKFWLLINGEWAPTGDVDADAEVRARCVAWVRAAKACLLPYTTGHYAVLADAVSGVTETINVAPGSGKRGASVDAALGKVSNGSEGGGGPLGCQYQFRNIYGANLARLRGIKAEYDPHNMFRLNDNIKPAGGSCPEGEAGDVVAQTA